MKEEKAKILPMKTLYDRQMLLSEFGLVMKKVKE